MVRELAVNCSPFDTSYSTLVDMPPNGLVHGVARLWLASVSASVGHAERVHRAAIVVKGEEQLFANSMGSVVPRVVVECSD